MSEIGFSPSEINGVAQRITAASATLGGIQRPNSPKPESFGKVLAAAGAHAFPYTTDGVRAYLDSSQQATQQMAQSLQLTARAYQEMEEAAEQIARSIFGGGGASAPKVGSVQMPRRDSWGRARDVLEQGAGQGGDASATGPHTAFAQLRWLVTKPNFKSVLMISLAQLFSYVAEQFGAFDEPLDQLSGDPGDVQQLQQAMTAVAQGLIQHAEQVAAAKGTSPNWFGPASDAFYVYADFEHDCMQAAAKVAELIGSRSVLIAGTTGEARRAAITVVMRAVYAVIELAFSKWWKLLVAIGVAVLSWILPIDARKALNWFLSKVDTTVAGALREIAALLQKVANSGAAQLGEVRWLGEAFTRAAAIIKDGKDPGAEQGLDRGSFGESMMGTEHKTRDGELIKLMANDPEGAGYEQVGEDEARSLGVTPQMLRNDENGFAAKIFKRMGADGKPEYVVVFEGTDFGDPQQRDMMKENLPGGIGVGPQTRMAIELAEALDRSPHSSNIIYAGHSLGGRLASVAALTSGNPAVTANSAGVSDATINYIAQSNGTSYEQLRSSADQGLIRSYRTSDDVLTFLQEEYFLTRDAMPDGLGTRFELGGDGKPSAEGHGSINVREQYDKSYGGR
ncbi:hypothetical protein [Tessaracoccus sp. OH4464_COT-324]|uniref:hypothetical protein n=1 Tax=Tessaracoccus sp. OH4464_COT-324 TaxID=2491059 RepID=UPI000F63B8B1|nr:hypothetical protein [Tessaracoccus sp. OH4464_COT-324]RRD47511.1 hypothetical protein EII42_02680 [Tessaracoccus sp. OH4464_COT-324]